jgi:hypothetical protein
VNLVTFAYDRLRQARFLLWPGLAVLLATAGCLQLANAATAESDPADLCVFHAQHVERLQHLPPGLLQAIALVESGRKLPAQDGRRPWPWTVRAGGEGWHLPNKETALGVIQRIRAEGRTSIDIGCMQINLRFHGHAFSSLQEALDPASNIAYAASFLRSLMAETGSWRDATAYYHSRDPTRAAGYLEKVTRIWRDIEPSGQGVLTLAEERVLRLVEKHELQLMVDEVRSALAQLHSAFIDLPLPDGPAFR